MPSEAPRAPATGRFLRLLRLALATGAAVLAIGAAEGLLRLRALPLGEAAARYVHGCYEPSQPRRYIHTKIRQLRLRIHRPDFEADCYFQGYSWRHRSDGFGWRNPETWQSAQVVVLGDSIVYGHGVEEEQTTPHFLRGLLGRRVVNLGVTGASPVHYLAFLRNFALPLGPRVIVVLSFGNDLADVAKIRTAGELERFVRTGEGRESRVFPRAKLLERARLPGGHRAVWLDRLALYRLVDYRLKLWRAGGSPPGIELGDGASPAAAGRLDLTPPADDVLDRMEDWLTVAYLRRALAMMADSSREAGAALVVGHVGRRTDADWMLRRVLREMAAEHGFHYFDTPVLEGPHRLPGDGHLSEAGHRLLAETLAAFLRERELL